MKQPELLTEWRTPYYGHAQTVTGDIWYEEDEAGKRTPLQPDIPSIADYKRMAEWKRQDREFDRVLADAKRLAPQAPGDT